MTRQACHPLELGSAPSCVRHVRSPASTSQRIGFRHQRINGSRCIPNHVVHTNPYFSWLYSLFLAIDANFRLKRKAVSSDKADPGLSHGWSYFVEEGSFKEHLMKHGDQLQDVSPSCISASTCVDSVPFKHSTCSSHNAVNNANVMSHHGLSTTGVGTVDCARHDIKRPCSVGDLQKGERSASQHFSTIYN
jgi:hypothetical protein